MFVSLWKNRATPASGGIFQKSWFRYWSKTSGKPVPVDNKFPCRDEECRVLPDGGVWIQSWDMTFKGTDGTDFVAGGVWLYKAPLRWPKPSALIFSSMSPWTNACA